MAHHHRIMVVDDDAEIVRGTMLRLRAAGYDATAAYDGGDALAQVEHKRPDLMLLDVRMPGIDGLAVLKNLGQRKGKNVPVIMLSASLRDEAGALRAGARFFLTKPYCGDDLMLAVGRVLSDANQDGLARCTLSFGEDGTNCEPAAVSQTNLECSHFLATTARTAASIATVALEDN